MNCHCCRRIQCMMYFLILVTSLLFMRLHRRSPVSIQPECLCCLPGQSIFGVATVSLPEVEGCSLGGLSAVTCTPVQFVSAVAPNALPILGIFLADVCLSSSTFWPRANHCPPYTRVDTPRCPAVITNIIIRIIIIISTISLRRGGISRPTVSGFSDAHPHV